MEKRKMPDENDNLIFLDQDSLDLEIKTVMQLILECLQQNGGYIFEYGDLDIRTGYAIIDGRYYMPDVAKQLINGLREVGIIPSIPVVLTGRQTE
jgi:hypothetical protein